MKTLSIRRWLMLSLLALFVVPVMLFNLTLPLFGGAQGWWAAHNQPTSADLDTAAGLFNPPSNWNDPSWRAATSERLSQLRIGAQILDPSGAVVYQSGTPSPNGPPWARNWAGSGNARQIQVVDGGTAVGTVDIYPLGGGGGAGFGVAALAALTGLVLTLLAFGWLIGRYVVRPLEATSLAARQIARGGLDFSLPDSRVREVDEVRAAFDAMGEGLRDSIERQAELEAERRFFVGAIAHDLRTPLFSLRGYLQGLERGIADTPEKIAAYVAVCSQKAEQLDRLVADLFAFARAEVLEEPLCAEPLELRGLLQQVAAGFSERASAREIEIRLTGTAGCLVSADRHLLERALENLLDNALRHTPAGGHIDLSCCCEAGRVTFQVTDSGPGIDGRDLPHLFEPLYRGETSRSRATGGAGLGLTIARRILRAHDGDLTAANHPAGGAQFTGWLPAPTA